MPATDEQLEKLCGEVVRQFDVYDGDVDPYDIVAMIRGLEGNKLHVDEVNQCVKDLQATDNVSDGYHTFGELYDHRITLFIALCHTIIGYAMDMGDARDEEVWKSKKHHDGSMFEGWFIAGIGKEPGKQISYHIPMSRWEELKCIELDNAPEWDGHTPAQALERIKQYVY